MTDKKLKMDRKMKVDPEASEDKRFSSIQDNPLYRRVPKKQKRIDIDKRFESMFHAKQFKLKYSMDKRGRPMSTTSDESLKRLYNLASDEELSESEEKEGPPLVQTATDIPTGEPGKPNLKEQSQPSGDKKEKVKKGDLVTSAALTKAERKKLHSVDVDYLRGEGQFASEESSSEDTSDDEAAVESKLENDSMHEWGEMDHDAESTEEATYRLGLCNMDWDRLNACDLMVLFHSFIPPGGILKCVTIYPSEFGKERLAEEELHGPKELVENNVGSMDNTELGQDGSEEEEGSGYNMEKLRKYQLNRLKYYYAILEFDSKETAEKVYTECDGMEYESSATRIDLRFVPDDMTFDSDPHDKWDSLPDAKKYNPRFFTTTALQQMKVDLTWDETDHRRKELTEKIFNRKETVDDEDIRAYLASSESESDVEAAEGAVDEHADEKGKDPILKYKALLQSIEDVEAKKKGKDVEMEITWGYGLKEKSADLVKKKQQEREKEKMTPWEEMLAKRREKRKLRKLDNPEKESDPAGHRSDSDSESSSKTSSAEDDQPFSDDDVDVDMNDPFFKDELRTNDTFKSKKVVKSKSVLAGEEAQKTKEEEKKRKRLAELDLLLMDGKHDERHFSLQKILDTEKSSKKYKKPRKGVKIDSGNAEDDFKVDVEDNRFSALYSSHLFSVDPSDPNFKKTKAMEAILSEKQKRRSRILEKKMEADTEKVQDPSYSRMDSKESELSHLIKSVKGKSLKLKKKEAITFKSKVLRPT